MRKFAYLKEPMKGGESCTVFKIMLYETLEGVYLFEYSSPDAVMSSADRWYESPEDVYEDWDDLVDGRGWMEMEDPLPDCQHDAFIPLRVKGRDTGKPEWGKWETLKDGSWIAYTPG